MAKGDHNLGWPGFFRAFTVLCAIMLLLAQGGQAEQRHPVLSVYEGLTLWAIPALFMLWGMFALEEGKPQISASLLGLALPAFCLLVVWGVVYAAAAPLLAGAGGNFTPGGLLDILARVVKGDTSQHLWVLYPLIGLYLLHPVIHRFTSAASQRELRYFLGLCFLFGSLLPVWTAFWPDSIAAGLLARLRVHLVSGCWVGCYVGGWYLRHYTISRVSEYILYLLGVLGLVLSVLSPSEALSAPVPLRQYDAPNVLLTATALCTLFRYVLGISEERSRRRAVSSLGACAFGVYLIHPLWALVFRRFGITVLSFSPALSVPLLALAFFLLSLPFAWLISLIPRVGPKLT